MHHPAFLLVAAAILALSKKKTRHRPVPCPKLVAGGGTLAGYDYLECATGGAKLSDRLPIIILLHGRASNWKSFSELLEGLPVRARIVMPRGRLGTKKNPIWFELRAATENQDALAMQMKEEARHLSTFIRDANRCLKGVGKPIVAGHSQGGEMALAVAAEDPRLIRGVAAASAWLPVKLWPRTLPPTHLAHGEGDTIVDYARTADFVARASGAGLPISLITVPAHSHGLSGDLKSAWLALVQEFMA